MRGEQNKVRSLDRRVNLSLAHVPHDDDTCQICSSPETEGRPDDVDKLVDAFLDELDALSGECRLAAGSSPSGNPQTGQSSEVFSAVPSSSSSSANDGLVRHFGSELALSRQDQEYASPHETMEGDPSQAPTPITISHPEGSNSGQRLVEKHILEDTSAAPVSLEAEIEAPGAVQLTPSEPAEPIPALAHGDLVVGSLFQEKRRDRATANRVAIIAIILMTGLAAGYFFFGITKSANPRTSRSNSQPAMAVAPVRSGMRGDVEVPVWPAGADDLRTTESPAKGVILERPDAGVLQIAPPVAVKKVMPGYPEAARGLGIDQPVEIDVSVDLDDQGNVLRATAMDGPAVFRSAAERALMKWSFKPAADKGINIRSTARVTIVFNP